jgi:hypothetical protein
MEAKACPQQEAMGCVVGVRGPVALVGKFVEGGMGSGPFARNKLK